MKRKFLTVLLFLLILPSIAFAAENVDVSVTGVRDYDAAYEVLRIVNAEREKAGLQPVSMNETLLDAAMQRAAEITLYYDSTHARPDGSACTTVIDDFPAYAKGENIAAGQENAEIVMNAWMNSDGHRSNILEKSFNTIGVGCFYQKEVGVYSWVQIFTSSTEGGFVTSGKKSKQFTIKANHKCFDDLAYYNPSASNEGLGAYYFICPGKTEEYRILTHNRDIFCIIDPECYTYKTNNTIFAVNGNDITGISQGKGKCDVYIKDDYIASFDVEIKHYMRDVYLPATCTEPGYQGGYCEICKYEEELQYVPALGHKEVRTPSVEPTCTKWGTTEGIYCERCNTTLQASEPVSSLGHNYKESVIEATCLEGGYFVYDCSRCGGHWAHETQPPIGHDWADSLTDENNYDIYTFCNRCDEKSIFMYGYEQLNDDVKFFMGRELNPGNEPVIMKYKAYYDKFSPEYKEKFLYKAELEEMVSYYEFFHMGDANRNGVIDSADLSILLSWYSGQYYLYDIVGDDDRINSDDLSMLLSNYGKSR